MVVDANFYLGGEGEVAAVFVPAHAAVVVAVAVAAEAAALVPAIVVAVAISVAAVAAGLVPAHTAAGSAFAFARFPPSIFQFQIFV
ncbi:hypothetical protein PV325_003954 [Microctonus aethiopoides]|nr:hypothetical protein PV325_003954 [Microctonus aethiopoides]